MNLTIDIGNSRTKFSLFNQGGLMFTVPVDTITPDHIDLLCNEHPQLKRAILSSVKDANQELNESLAERFETFIELNHHTPLPLTVHYKTPETLGKDRIAAVVGANYLFPGTNLLVIDAGTAITFDMITEANEYAGGNISPGLTMRFKALHTFTSKLPLVEPSDDFDGWGLSTVSAIRAGVQYGILFEVEAYIERFKEFYENFKIIFTGGDINFFERNLKNSFFADSNLVAIGLNRILEYNAKDL